MNDDGTIEKIVLPLLLISLPLTVIDVLLPMYTEGLGFTPVQITGLFSVFSFFLIIMRLFIGKLTDSKGRKFIFIRGILFYAVSYYFYSISYNIIFVYLARSLEAIAAGCIGISSYSMVADLNTSRGYNFGKINGYAQRGGLLGIALCFIIFYSADFSEGWARLFKICAFAAAIAFVYSFFRIKSTMTPCINAEKTDLPPVKQKIMVFKFIASIFLNLDSAIFALYLVKKFNAGLEEIGIAFLLPALVAAFISQKLGKISDNKGPYKATGISVALMIVSLILLPLMNSVYMFGIIWTLYSVAIILFNITLNGMFTADMEEGRGYAVSKYTIASNMGGIIGPVIGGALFQEININAPFLASGAAFSILLLSISKWFPLLSDEKI